MRASAGHDIYICNFGTIKASIETISDTKGEDISLPTS